jgi:hypothetical protein
MTREVRMARFVAVSIAALICGAGLGGCGGRGHGGPEGEAGAVKFVPAATPAADRAVIGHLVTRSHLITILSDGPRFTVETLDGKPVAEKVSLEGLEALDPNAASAFRNGFTDRAGVLDASVSPDGDL